MKPIIIVIVLFAVGKTFSQNSNSEFLYPFQLKKVQQKSWEKIQTNWLNTVYMKYVEKAKIKISDCASCGDLYIDIEATINNNGKFIYEATSAKKCGKPMTPKLEKFLMHYFVIKTFPKQLHNQKIKTRLGFLLKC